MVDWSSLLSQDARARLDKTRAEIRRLYALPDRWLAEELLRLSRKLRLEFPDWLGYPVRKTYDSEFVWHLVPEVARRLGARSLLRNEAAMRDIVALEDADFRCCAGAIFKNLSMRRWPSSTPADTPSSAEILAHEIANGNPVAFAIDRFIPPSAKDHDRDDWLARHMREISFARGFEPTPCWSPALTPSPRNRGPSDDAGKVLPLRPLALPPSPPRGDPDPAP
jgi:hypothetical protein